MEAGTHIRQCGRFEAGKVREQDPVPTCEKDVLSLYVTVGDLLVVAFFKNLEKLEDNPLLLHYTEKGACAGWVWREERRRM